MPGDFKEKKITQQKVEGSKGWYVSPKTVCYGRCPLDDSVDSLILNRLISPSCWS